MRSAKVALMFRRSTSFVGKAWSALVRTIRGVRRGIWRWTVAGLLVGAVASGACYWALNTWAAWRLEGLASRTKTWPTGTILDNVNVEVTTRCSRSELSYTVSIVPPPPTDPTLNRGERTDAARAATDRVRTRLKAIRLQFVDASGVPTAAYELPMEGFIRIYSNSDERLTRLEDRSVLTCSPARYVRASTMKLDWVERGE